MVFSFVVNHFPMITRRTVLKRATLLTLLANTGLANELFSEAFAKRIRIGACDWSLGKNSDPAAFDIAKTIGLQGVQVNMGTVQNNLHLRDLEIQQLYLKKSKETGIEISSLAIGELNNVPYKSDPRTEQWVSDSIDVAKNLGVKVILLAFFNKNDLRNDTVGKQEVINRLKKVVSKAEQNGITLGIESYLSAEELVGIIQQVGSKSVKIYYDFRNSADAGYDVIREIRFLGKDAICELHMKENGFLLGQGTMDWKRIGETLMSMGYYGDGWMQIEWASPKDADIIQSYKHNLKFLQDIFHT